MMEKLGAIPLSNEILKKANIGLWAFELDEGQPPRMYADETMLGLLGLKEQKTPEELYHAWYDYIDEKSYGLVSEAVAKMQIGEHAEVQYPWHHPDGNTVWIVRCGGVRNFNYTQGIRIEGTHQNVTEVLHFQEEQYKETMRVLSIIAETYSAAYYVNFESDSYAVYASSQQVSATVGPLIEGKNIANALKGFGRLVYSEDKALFEDYASHLLEYAQKGGGRCSVIFRRGYADGSYMYNESVFAIDRAFPQRGLLVFRNVNDEELERQQAQKRLEKALEDAQIANKAKTLFLFNMSHDTRTPMNAITGYTTLAKKYINDPEKLEKYLTKIHYASNNLLELINQVLDMSKIEAGKVAINEVPADVVDRAYSMLSIVEHSANVKDISIKIDTSEVQYGKIYADATKMTQIMLNILVNSIKYTPSGGHISYTVKQLPCNKNGFLKYAFTIEDNGIGMSKEFLAKIYDPFMRANSTTVSKIDGTGLGMSIVKRLVDLLQGEIVIESELGKGTKTTVIMTFRKCTEDSKVDTEQRVSDSVLQGKRILLVEDNEMNCEIATELLGEHGFIIDTAEDGDIAVDILQKLYTAGKYPYYDFVLMDVQMPRMSGYDATRAIRNMEMAGAVRIPIIAMTANAYEEDKMNALAAGMDDHLAKPIEIEKLLGTLAKYL